MLGADDLSTAGAVFLRVDVHTDDRGALASIDFEDIPFAVRRVFVVTNVPAGTRRGGHSHRHGSQALFCLNGRVEVELRRSDASAIVTLRPDGVGLEIDAGVWSSQYYVGSGSELLVLASQPYNPDDYETNPSSAT